MEGHISEISSRVKFSLKRWYGAIKLHITKITSCGVAIFFTYLALWLSLIKQRIKEWFVCISYIKTWFRRRTIRCLIRIGCLL